MTVSRPMIDTALAHRSIRRFTEEPIAADILQTILTAGQMASTSSFLQSVSIIRVTDIAKRVKLREICAGDVANGHKYVEHCAEFLVFCIDTLRHHQLAAQAQTDWVEVLMVGAVDVGIFAQNVLLSAESLGLGGVFIGGVRNDMAAVTELLNIPKYVIPMVGMCLGYPAQEPAQRPRLPLAAILSENAYQPADESTLAAYNETVHNYYQTRNLDLTWQQQVQDTLAREIRPEMLSYLQKQGFAQR